MVGARVGVALGISNVGKGGGSVGLVVGSSIGVCVWVGERVGFLIAGVEAVVVVVAASSDKLGTKRRCPR